VAYFRFGNCSMYQICSFEYDVHVRLACENAGPHLDCCCEACRRHVRAGWEKARTEIMVGSALYNLGEAQEAPMSLKQGCTKLLDRAYAFVGSWSSRMCF
jgi:hypothetical protein